ncbi:MAG: hypothetical protein HOC79_05685 [Euryarchaeota archaeon]|jgi:hypothetical protein|nr:hypothetical protein [Euryarchaeota archaeon]
MKTEHEINKIRYQLNEQLEQARLSELRLDTLNQMAVCETEIGHEWKVHSYKGELTSLHTVKLWCGNCPCWINIDNSDLAFTRGETVMISFNGMSQTLTSWLNDEAECAHLNHTDTLTGSVCNDCGEEYNGGEEE